MFSAYEVHLRQEAFEFLLAQKKSNRELLMRHLQRLGKDPFLAYDVQEHDAVGRPISGAIVNRFAVLYWCAHFFKEIRIVDIRSADSP